MDEKNSENYCIDCFYNEGVKSWFERVGEKGFCGYCNQNNKLSAPIEDFCDFFIQCASTLYSNPDEECMSYISREGGWQGKTYETEEIIEFTELETDDEVRFEPINHALMHISWLWCDRDHQQLSERDRLLFDWKNFKEIVLHQARYVFLHQLEEGYTEHRGQPYNVNEILNEIGSLISKHKLIKKLPAGTKIYRVRIPSDNVKLSSYEQLCIPECEHTIFPNRMSPAGISMFYGALDQRTAYQEVYDPKKSPACFVSAIFKTTQDMHFVDFTSLPPYPELLSLETTNNYDNEEPERLRFLYQFIHDLAKPVEKDGQIHIEYVPTQIVTEYIRYIFNPNRPNPNDIMGIKYHSAVEASGKCIVLFVDPPSKYYSDRHTKKWLDLHSHSEIKI